MSNSTPGPWFAVQPERANGWWIVNTQADGEGSDVDNSGDGGFSEANARLIAAAPDLLEALVALRNHLSGTPRPSTLKALLANADVAIARAGGDQ